MKEFGAELMFAFQSNDKFSFVAVENCAAAPKADFVLRDGTHILSKIPGDISGTWKKWIGELRTEALVRSNLIILRRIQSTTPQILDEEHGDLLRQATDMFWLLQLSGVLRYNSAAALQGSVESDGHFTVRQMVQLRNFYPASEPRIEQVSLERLEEASVGRQSRDQFRREDTHDRLRRGIGILIDALQSKYGSERLHQSVRALEALIVPPIGKTRRTFIHRCRLFATPTPALETLLGRWFDMRSDVEHVHPLEKSLHDIHESERELFGMRCTRQATALACFAYRTILREPSLHTIFKNDQTLDDFWKKDDAARQKLWPSQLNIASIP